MNVRRHEAGLVSVISGLGIGLCATAGKLGLAAASATILSLLPAGPLIVGAYYPAVSFWVPIMDVRGYTLTAADIILVAIVWTSVIAVLRGKRLTGGSVWTPVAFISIYTALMMLSSAIGSGNVLGELLTTLKRTTQYAVLVPCAMLLISRRNSPYISVGVMGASLAVSVLSVADYLVNGRTGGPLFYSNVLGLYGAATWNLAVSYVIDADQTRVMRILGGLSALAGFLTLLVSESRSASIGWVAGTVWLLGQLRMSRRARLRLTALVVLLVALSALSPAGRSFWLRWGDFGRERMQTSQVAARLEAQRIGMDVFLSSPVLGVGIDGLPSASEAYLSTLSTTIMGSDLVYNAGSQWTQVLAESGLVGTIPFVLALASMYVLATRNTSTRSPGRPFCRALASTVVVCVVAGVGMHTFIVPCISSLMWLELSCIGVLCGPARPKEVA